MTDWRDSTWNDAAKKSDFGRKSPVKDPLEGLYRACEKHNPNAFLRNDFQDGYAYGCPDCWRATALAAKEGGFEDGLAQAIKVDCADCEARGHLAGLLEAAALCEGVPDKDHGDCPACAPIRARITELEGGRK